MAYNKETSWRATGGLGGGDLPEWQLPWRELWGFWLITLELTIWNIDSFDRERADIWRAGAVERYFSQPTNTVSQTSPARQISLVKTVRTIDIFGKNRLSISLPTTLHLFLLFYPFTFTLPTTNSPLPIRKIKLMPALSSTSGDITGSDRTVPLLVAGIRPRRFHHLDLAVDRR